MCGLCVFLLSILTQGKSIYCTFLCSAILSSHTSSNVIGIIGHNVTLPCRYDTKHHGELSFCWGRGKVPTSKCSDTILTAADWAEQSSQSSRYQLLGRVMDGDISLTILDAQWSDGGVYGCRIEVPGWFNDHKVNTQLVMEEGNAHAN
uniref:Ig-like domain-containing protein n=1 Tax=Echeneis naucrates TaxID=173247 RepID=A0A665VUQ4_ECHNA